MWEGWPHVSHVAPYTTVVFFRESDLHFPVHRLYRGLIASAKTFSAAEPASGLLQLLLVHFGVQPTFRHIHGNPKVIQCSVAIANALDCLHRAQVNLEGFCSFLSTRGRHRVSHAAGSLCQHQGDKEQPALFGALNGCTGVFYPTMMSPTSPSLLMLQTTARQCKRSPSREELAASV